MPDDLHIYGLYFKGDTKYCALSCNNHLLKAYYLPSTMLSTLFTLYHLVFVNDTKYRLYCCHFIDKTIAYKCTTGQKVMEPEVQPV